MHALPLQAVPGSFCHRHNQIISDIMDKLLVGNDLPRIS